MSSRAQQKQTKRVVREQLARERRRRRTMLTTATAVALLLVAGLVGWGVYASQRSDDWTAPPGTVDDGSGIPQGTGPVVVDVYADYLCPACRQFEQTTGPTLDDLVEQGRITLVHHPIAILDRESTTRYSTRASSAAGCASEGGRFPAFNRALFDDQPEQGGAGLSDDRLIEIGASAGLTGADFAQCVRDRKYEGWAAHLTDLASERGVTGTPTILVDGKPVQDRSPQGITAAVEAAAS